MRAIVLLFMLYAGAQPVRAHDYWSDGKRVDPITKNLCCSGSDTKELDPAVVKPVAGGFLLTDTHEFIPADRVQPSPDSAIWASRWGGETRCFFYPFSF
ncbi:hypothetical protein SAMN05519103_00743 [Rhizobiales bacterium GAS113]|jgi:hypothetical protein|nr:hypothetical protein SAMN05519103_00743 [Rhizobiales bacterium GAS113]SEC59395.1 hypothetical protein SAMN05519104_1679 [Rhizobiales bacterium GAS188]